MNLPLALDHAGKQYHRRDGSGWSCRAWSGDYDQSIAVASQLRQSFPNFRQLYNELIAALGQEGRVDEAREVIAEGPKRFSGNPFAF